MGMQLDIASLAELEEVLGVLDEAAGWLKEVGVDDQWPPRFRPGMVAPAVERGETWLARVDGAVVGTITLDWDDPLWADAEGTAGYVHRLAVRRSAAGRGAWLLDWAVGATREQEREFVRLDCARSNRRLRSYYEDRGFQHHGDVQVGRREQDGPMIWMSRYQLPL